VINNGIGGGASGIPTQRRRAGALSSSNTENSQHACLLKSGTKSNQVRNLELPLDPGLRPTDQGSTLLISLHTYILEL